jgi:predicted acylesterase/phospholipase RssA
VGVCEHLICEGGYWFDVIAGVSVGAINGTTLAHARDQEDLAVHLERLRSVWFGLRGNEDVYRRRRLGFLRLVAGWRSGIFDVDPLRGILLRHIDPPRVAASPIRLRVGYYDLLSRSHRTAGNDYPALRSAVLASSSLPILFPATPLASGRELGVDGGTKGEIPVVAALRALAELPPDGEPLEVWVIRLQPPRSASAVEKWFRRTLSSLAPGLDDPLPALQHVRMRVLHPLRSLPGSYLDFHPEDIRHYYMDGLHTARGWRKDLVAAPGIVVGDAPLSATG